ncbi:MAG TPA: FecR domain-containing protein [Cyclobacteriaceae bacterium]|nr:FecR domain-containing protein [Cyclobacteriaceae bacterium]
MKNYKDYSVDDFITDDNFIRWVQFPSDETNLFWSEFTAKNPRKLSDVEEAVRFLKSFGNQTPELPREKLLRLHQQIIDRIDVPVSASTVHEIVRSRSRKNRTYLYAAVITMALLAFASWWLVNLSPSVDYIEPVAVQKKRSVSHLREHVIPKGKRSRITLEDGTHVWINADSKLKYSPDFLKGATRDVYLQGEAFFDVTSDKSHPFIVHVQGVEIKVLGTSFNVKGYEGDSRIEATLVHGKITIAGDSAYDNVTLAANQRAVFLKEKRNLLVENNVETDTYTSWRQGVLVFDDQPLYEILPILERTFNVSIHTDEASSLDCRFTAKINNKSLKEVLELFRTSDTIGYTIAGSDVYLEGSFCND